MIFTSSRDAVRAESRARAERLQKAARDSGIDPGTFLTGGRGQAGASRLSDNRQQQSDASEQVTHFRGQFYTSVRPIAARIAGQPIRLARAARARPKGKNSRRPAGGRSSAFLSEATAAMIRKIAGPRGLSLSGNLYDKDYGLRDGDIELVDQHPVLDALHDPAPSIPGWTAWHLKYIWACSMKVTGAAYWWFPKIKGKTEIYFTPPHWIHAIPEPGKPFAKWAMRPPGASEDTFVDLDAIVPWWYPDVSNPMRRKGPMEACAREIFVDEYVIEALKRHFQQGFSPDALVYVNGGMTPEGKPRRVRVKKWQMDQVKTAFRALLQGVLHHSEPAFLDSTLDIRPWGRTPNEMDYGGNMDKTQARVEQAVGTNAWIAGASGLGSRAESAVADAHFVYSTVNPDIELLSLGLTNDVLPRYGDGDDYVLFVEPARPRDDEMQLKIWEVGQKYCAGEINEFRTKMMGLPPSDWGNCIAVPTGVSLVPTAQLKNGFVNSKTDGIQPGIVDPATVSQDGDDTGAGRLEGPEEEAEGEALGEEADDKSVGGISARVRGKSPRRAGGRQPHFLAVKTIIDTREHIETWLKRHGQHEKSIAVALKSFQAKQAESVLSAFDDIGKRIPGGGSNPNPDVMAALLFKPADWIGELKEAVKAPLVYGWAAGTAHELASVGQGTPLPMPADAVDAMKKIRRLLARSPGSLYLLKEATIDLLFDFGVDFPKDVMSGIESGIKEAFEQDYWQKILDTQRDDISRAIQDAISQGGGSRDVRAAVEDVFDGEVSKNRADNIARTETTGALNAGAQEARIYLEKEQIIDGKTWFSIRDMRTRPHHAEADGQEKKVTEPFIVGGYAARYPGDPMLPAGERCRCRCTSASHTIFSEEKSVVVGIVHWRAGGCEAHGARKVGSGWPYEKRVAV